MLLDFVLVVVDCRYPVRFNKACDRKYNGVTLQYNLSKGSLIGCFIAANLKFFSICGLIHSQFFTFHQEINNVDMANAIP